MASKYGYHGFGATSWAWHTIDLRQPSSNGRLVLLGLARYYDDKKGYCYPTIEELQKATGLGNTSVKAARKELRDAGIIAWKHRSNPGGYSNCVYTFPQYLPDTESRRAPAPRTGHSEHTCSHELHRGATCGGADPAARVSRWRQLRDRVTCVTQGRQTTVGVGATVATRP